MPDFIIMGAMAMASIIIGFIIIKIIMAPRQTTTATVPQSRNDLQGMSPEQIRAFGETYIKSLESLAKGAADSSSPITGPRTRYEQAFLDRTENLKLRGENYSDNGELLVTRSFHDASVKKDITLITGKEKAERLGTLKAEADLFSDKGFYEHKGKTCGVFLNYLLSGWTSVDPRVGADKDTTTLTNLFTDMGIDGDNMFICEDLPYKERLDAVITTVKEGGYSSLIFAIGTHGGTTPNSLIVLNESKELVQIDLYEHIIYVLSKELPTIPKIFLVQACRNRKENELPKIPIQGSNVTPQDVCVVTATIPNRTAFRCRYTGSYFFTHLNAVIRERAKDWGLRKIVYEAGNRIVQIEDCSSQIPHIDSMQCKKEYKFKNPKKRQNRS